jgi:hypothetical protein
VGVRVDVAVPVADLVMVPEFDAVLDGVLVEDGVAEADADGDTGASASPRNCVSLSATITGAPPFSHVNAAAANAYTLVGVITYSVAPSAPSADCVTFTSATAKPGTYTVASVVHVEPLSVTRRRPAALSHTNSHEAL